MDTEIPREFQLLDELHESSTFNGISYGLEDPTDNTFTKWTGSLMANTGHCVNLMFTCDENYPNTKPDISFDKTYINQIESDYEDEFKSYLTNIHQICDKGTSKLKDDIITWNKKKTIGIVLQELRNIIFCIY